MLALIRRTTTLAHEAGMVARWMGTKVRMPVHAEPQLCVTATGKHKQGVLEGLTAAIAEHGGSIASAKRVETGGVFSAILEVWMPPNAAELTADDLSAKLDSSGIVIGVMDLEEKSPILQEATEPWHLTIEGPQKPGLMNGLTKILLDGESVVKRMEADTASSDTGVSFAATGLILCRPGSGPKIKEKLRTWTYAYENVTKFDFVRA